MDDLLADFLTETNESLAELDTALVKLERIPNDQPRAPSNDLLGCRCRERIEVAGACERFIKRVDQAQAVRDDTHSAKVVSLLQVP